MTASEWKRLIKRQTTKVGTYQKSFDAAITTLAQLLEERDNAYQQFVDEGALFLVEKVSDRGATNLVQNPLLRVWMDLNRDALAYWRDLGLTPAGLKRLNEDALKPTKKGSSLEEALKQLGGGA